jgi:hypothetical protein
MNQQQVLNLTDLKVFFNQLIVPFSFITKSEELEANKVQRGFIPLLPSSFSSILVLISQ